MRHILTNLLYLFILLILIIVFNYAFISYKAKNKTSANIQRIPQSKYALLLGTSMLMDNGDTNLFFKYRCLSAFNLWRANKFDYLVISGDSANSRYDEVEWMRNKMLELGMPDTVIIKDKKGFNTLASLEFCKDSLKTQSLIIISQRFHNERAMLLAQKIGMIAVGYNAKNVYTWYGWKTMVREFAARIKATLQILIN